MYDIVAQRMCWEICISRFPRGLAANHYLALRLLCFPRRNRNAMTHTLDKLDALVTG